MIPLQLRARSADRCAMERSTRADAGVHGYWLTRLTKASLDFAWNTRCYGLRLAVRWLMEGRNGSRRASS